MKKVKALLYCTKAKPFLFEVEKDDNQVLYATTRLGNLDSCRINHKKVLNGKIVAECEVETEELFIKKGIGWTSTSGMTEEEILHKSQLRKNKLNEYLGDNGYALHISNLAIFKKPKELNNYIIDNTKTYGSFGWAFEENKKYISLKKAPQNMMRVYDSWDADENGSGELCVLISIRPEWLCKILNGEKTIEVRKRVLKGMIDNPI